MRLAFSLGLSLCLALTAQAQTGPPGLAPSMPPNVGPGATVSMVDSGQRTEPPIAGTAVPGTPTAGAPTVRIPLHKAHRPTPAAPAGAAPPSKFTKGRITRPPR